MRSLEVGNISISFVQGSKQLLLRKRRQDFSYAAKCLLAEVSCISMVLPNGLRLFSFHINKYRFISLRYSSLRISRLIFLLALRFLRVQHIQKTISSIRLIPYSLLSTSLDSGLYFFILDLIYRISETIEDFYFLDKELSFPRDLGLPILLTVPYETFFKECFLIINGLFSLLSV